jgi:hypothetical protein
MTITAAARHLGVGWDLVKEIQKDNLTKRCRSVKLAKAKHIAIDEMYQGKKQDYLTVSSPRIAAKAIFTLKSLLYCVRFLLMNITVHVRA